MHIIQSAVNKNDVTPFQSDARVAEEKANQLDQIVSNAHIFSREVSDI